MVSAPTPDKRYSIDDLAGFPDDGKLRELMDGQIVEWDVPTWEHSELEALLASHMLRFVQEHRLGRVGSGEAMVRIQGSMHDARGADIAFYGRGRRPIDRRAAATAAVPDLVVEIISPSDRADRIIDKVRDWLRAGVRLLWYVNPETGVTAAYQGNTVSFVGPEEELLGGEVLPDFTIRLGDLLRELEEDA